MGIAWPDTDRDFGLALSRTCANTEALAIQF